MARALFINGGSEGHVNPTIGVVKELVSRGEEVVYFTIEDYRERIEKTGAKVRTFDAQKFLHAFISGGRNNILERINGLLLTADIMIPSVLEQIQGEHFDYLIHDSMFGCGRLLAQILKLPAISSCTSFAETEDSFKDMFQQLSKDIPSETFAEYQRLADSMKEKYGVHIHSPYEVFCNPAPLTVVYTIREFQPFGEDFDESYKFVGPSITEQSTQEGFDFTSVEGKRTIYISLGTVFNQETDFYKLCFDAFRQTDYNVVMSIGGKVQITELGEIPENFMVRNYVPQTEVLKHAHLFITHGGMNSVHEGLYFGVPLIVIPQSADQPAIAEQVVRVGAGRQLQMQSLTSDQLFKTSEQVLNQPSIQKAVTRMKESLHSAGGYQQAVDEISKLINPYDI